MLKLEAGIAARRFIGRRRGDALKIEAKRLKTGIRLANDGLTELGEAAAEYEGFPARKSCTLELQSWPELIDY